MTLLNRKSLLQRGWHTFLHEKWGYFFLLPSLVPFTLFFIVPLVKAVILSFNAAPLGKWKWGGLANYITVFHDHVFWVATKNTVIYTVVVVFGITAIALILSVLIFSLGNVWQGFFKGAFYLPSIVSSVVVILIWSWLFNPAFGLLNYLLSLVNLPPVVWLGNTHTALPSLMVMALSTGTGTGVILITAAMASIPTDLYDAARVDGAGGWNLFWKITLPLIQPVLLYLLVITTIDCFQIFTPMWMLTSGGPQQSTLSVAYLIYRTAFQSFKFGVAAAQSVFLFFFILVVSIIYFRMMGKEVSY
jgi:multiple sugar transport system permease protein